MCIFKQRWREFIPQWREKWTWSPNFCTTRTLHAPLLPSCLTLCDPTDYSPPGSSVHRSLKARILEGITVPFSRGSSWPRDGTRVSCVAGGFLNHLSYQASPRTLDQEKRSHIFTICKSETLVNCTDELEVTLVKCFNDVSLQTVIHTESGAFHMKYILPLQRHKCIGGTSCSLVCEYLW